MKSVLVVCIVATICGAAKLPSLILKCDMKAADLADCLQKSAEKSWPELFKGDTSIHFVSTDPLFVPRMDLDIDGGLKINLTNSNIYGIKQTKFNYMKLDPAKKTFDMELNIPLVNYIGTYDINGKILSLPITGNGNANITYVGGLYTYHFDYDIQQDKKGKDHIHIIKNTLKYKVDRAYFQLENLFNNKQLSDNMNLVLDDNWKDVNNEIGSKVGDGLGEVVTAVIEAFFARVPISDLFIE